MIGKVRKRPKLALDDDLDLSGFGANEPATSETAPSVSEVKAVSERGGFVSRSAGAPTLRRRRRKTSPFQHPIGIKSRAGMKELFQDLGDLLDTHDHTTFERAVEALIKQTGDKALLERYKQLTEVP